MNATTPLPTPAAVQVLVGPAADQSAADRVPGQAPDQHSGQPTGPSADDLHAQLTAAGFHPGTPRGLSVAAQAEDAHAARLRCHGCNRRGLCYKPYTRTDAAGRSRYRVVASCPACNAAEEV